jgi:hypothetical protein
MSADARCGCVKTDSDDAGAVSSNDLVSGRFNFGLWYAIHSFCVYDGCLNVARANEICIGDFLHACLRHLSYRSDRRIDRSRQFGQSCSRNRHEFSQKLWPSRQQQHERADQRSTVAATIGQLRFGQGSEQIVYG